ncbi:MAG: DNA-3-methyladenine glycosylase I [Hyphomonadaceae bacterium]
MPLAKFSKIEGYAEKRHGGAKGVAEILKQHPGGKPSDLKRGDDRFLAGMAQGVFSAGFNWKVIEAKWDGFEEAFFGFNVRKVASFDDDDIARLLADTRIVRHGPKIKSTIENARFILEIAKEHGSFGKFLRDWPASDQIGLIEVLKTRGSRLGGATGSYFLRFNGWDAFILSRDVVAALIREGVIDKAPTGKAAMKAVQEAFNVWTRESGRPQREVSRILALSVG